MFGEGIPLTHDELIVPSTAPSDVPPAPLHGEHFGLESSWSSSGTSDGSYIEYIVDGLCLDNAFCGVLVGSIGGFNDGVGDSFDDGFRDAFDDGVDDGFDDGFGDAADNRVDDGFDDDGAYDIGNYGVDHGVHDGVDGVDDGVDDGIDHDVDHVVVRRSLVGIHDGPDTVSLRASDGSRESSDVQHRGDSDGIKDSPVVRRGPVIPLQ